MKTRTRQKVTRQFMALYPVVSNLLLNNIEMEKKIKRLKPISQRIAIIQKVSLVTVSLFFFLAVAFNMSHAKSKTIKNVNYPLAKIEVLPVIECKLTFAKFKSSTALLLPQNNEHALNECQESVEERCSRFQERIDSGEFIAQAWNIEFGQCFDHARGFSFAQAKPNLKCFCGIENQVELSYHNEE